MEPEPTEPTLVPGSGQPSSGDRPSVEPGRGRGGKWVEFCEPDPFNGGIVVKGYLNRTSKGRAYGALHIVEVDGQPCDQLIWGTPKQQYPYVTDRRSGEVSTLFPPIDRVRVYEKLDGTNVLAYAYQAPVLRSESDSFAAGGESRGIEWRTMVSYKTRLQPFMAMRFKEFWDEVLALHPDIPGLVELNGCNLSFEMYGKKNQHMLLYEVGLDAALLFGVTPGMDPNGLETSRVIPPDELETGTVSAPELIRVLDSATDLTRAYVDIRAWLNDQIQEEQKVEENDLVQGMEGAVWYAHSREGVLQYKCKPDYVQDIHFMNKNAIPRHALRTTILNAYEDTDDPDLDYVLELLKEEFSKELLEENRGKVSSMLAYVKDEMQVKRMVLDIYKQSGLDFATQTAGVMRAVARELLADVPKGTTRRKRVSQMAFKMLSQLKD